MKNFKRFFCLAALIATASTQAIAVNVWVTDRPVRGVQSHPDGSVSFQVPGGAAPGCTENGSYFIAKSGQNSMNSDGVKMTAAMVLSAFATQKTITFAYDNNISAQLPLCYVSSVFVNP